MRRSKQGHWQVPTEPKKEPMKKLIPSFHRSWSISGKLTRTAMCACACLMTLKESRNGILVCNFPCNFQTFNASYLLIFTLSKICWV